MNHREQTHLRRGVRRTLHSLSLLLLPIVAPKTVSALTLPRARADRSAESGEDRAQQPYLPVIGTLALRFQAAPPPPDLTSRPAAAAPPVPALSPTETAVAQANLAAANPGAPVVPAALVALVVLALAASVALARVAAAVSVVLARVAPADPALKADPAVTVDLARRVDLAAAGLLALLGIPRTDPDAMDPVAMDPVVAHVVRTSVLNR